MSKRQDIIARLLVPLLLVLGIAGFALPATAAPCTQNCLTPGDYDMQVTISGYLRLYKVHVPAKYTGAAAVPLTLDIHGHALTNDDQRTRSGQLQQSDKYGFIVAWPQGIANSWNGNGCCTVAYDLKIDDVGFMRAIVATIQARANIDTDRIYATGWSNGAGMTQRLACEASDLIRAIAPVAHPLNSNTCTPARPVSVLAFHGTADTTIPYAGGGATLPREVLGVPLGWQGAVQSLAAWKAIRGCSDTVSATQLTGASRDQTYRTCADGSTVGLVSVADGEHDLYTAPTAGSAAAASHLAVAEYIWTHLFRP